MHTGRECKQGTELDFFNKSAKPDLLFSPRIYPRVRDMGAKKILTRARPEEGQLRKVGMRFDPVTPQQFPKFLNESPSAMMFFLPLDVPANVLHA